jgi:Ca-activated chloride channel homolog
MILTGIMLMIVCSNSVYADFLSHARAVVAGQSGDLQSARNLLATELIKKPKDCTLLYDNGVAEFKLGNYDSAAHYFEKVSQITDDQSKKKEAFFNAANAYVHLKDYDQALHMYEKVLTLENNHEKARYNYELVKKMKEQEKGDENQQEQKPNQNNKPQKNDGQPGGGNGNSNEKQNSNDASEREEQGDSGDDQSSDNDQQKSKQSKKQHTQKNDQQQEHESNEDNNEKESNDDDTLDKNSDCRKDQQSTEKPHNKNKNTGTQNNQSTQAKDKASFDRQNNEYGKDDKTKKGERHEAPSEQKASLPHSTDPTLQEQSKGFCQGTESPDLAGCDKQWMRAALEACDKQDGNHNKQLLRAMVGGQGEGASNAHASW